jgi:hypothetical protein
MEKRSRRRILIWRTYWPLRAFSRMRADARGYPLWPRAPKLYSRAGYRCARPIPPSLTSGLQHTAGPYRGSGRLDTRLDTPPSINRRHPDRRGKRRQAPGAAPDEVIVQKTVVSNLRLIVRSLVARVGSARRGQCRFELTIHNSARILGLVPDQQVSILGRD